MSDELGVNELADLLADHEPMDLVVPSDPSEVEGSYDEVYKKEQQEREESRKHKRRKRSRHGAKSRIKHSGGRKSDGVNPRVRSKFVIDAAESGETESDDGFVVGSDEDGESDVYGGPMAMREGGKRHIFPEGEEDMTAEEVARAIEERYRSGRKKANRTEALLSSGIPKGKLSSLRYASHLLPQDTDPKVFAVKCRPRMARVLVARLVNKCYAFRIGRNYEKRKVDLGIISVFCFDHVKEYIYIESHRKAFVENAINGLVGLFRSNISLVNPSELMQMMEHRPSEDKIRLGSFVRLRRRQYRLDIAQVIAVDSASRRVTVKVVPREDFVGKTCNKPEVRMPQRLFVPNLAVGAHNRGEMYTWGDLIFDGEGYLHLSVSLSQVISGVKMEKPTVEELAAFFSSDLNRVREAASHFASNGRGSAGLRIGDMVRVVSGQLRETVGTIENIFLDTNTVALSCRVPMKGETIKLRVELPLCVKHFTEGTHVVIDGGVHAGESGTVVKALGDVVHVFSDRATATRELVVRADDCHRSNLVGSFGHTSGSWKLFDLVMLPDSSSVACVVRLNRNDVCVLTDRMETRYLSTTQIKPVLTGRRQTTDQLANMITRGSEVIIQNDDSSPYHLDGQTGRVEQVFNTTLFVRVKTVKENSGLVAVDASCVLLIGGRTTTKQIQPAKQLPTVNRNPHNASRADLSVPNPRMTSEDWAGNSEWYEMDIE